MPPVSGFGFLVKIGNERQQITVNLGSAGEVFRLNFEGAQTADIAFDAAASVVQTALEGLSTIGAGNVVVTGAAGGPYTVAFQGTLAGQDVPLLTGSNFTGNLTLTIVALSTTFTTLGGQRNATLNRGNEETDTTSKDSAGWHEGQPIIRSWGLETDILHLQSPVDASFTALESAFLNRRLVHVQVLTPAGNTYTGVATIADLPLEGPHDDVLTGSLSLQGSGVLTKV